VTPVEISNPIDLGALPSCKIPARPERRYRLDGVSPNPKTLALQDKRSCLRLARRSLISGDLSFDGCNELRGWFPVWLVLSNRRDSISHLSCCDLKPRNLCRGGFERNAIDPDHVPHGGPPTRGENDIGALVAPTPASVAVAGRHTRLIRSETSLEEQAQADEIGDQAKIRRCVSELSQPPVDGSNF